MTWADRAPEEIADRTGLACAAVVVALTVVILL